MVFRSFSIAALVGGGWFLGSLSGTVPPTPTEKERSQDEAATAASRPTDEHRWLAQDVGIWETTARDLVAGVSHKPPYDGTTTVTMLPGGLWQIADHRTNDGALAVHTITGWDAATKKVITITVSSRSPVPWFSAGTFDPAKKTLTSEASRIAAGPPMNQREIHTRTDPNHRRFEVRLPLRTESGAITDMPWEAGLEVELTRK